MSTRTEWETERTVAYMWDCGDEECDCVMPVIERVTPNRDAGYPWIHRDRIWEGTFVSRGNRDPGDPTEEQLYDELRAACMERNLPYGEDA